MDNVIVLWSGGFDSTGLILWALNQKLNVFPLFLNRHQSNYRWEKKAINLLYLEIKKNYPSLKLNPFREFEIITPPKELKEEFGQTKLKYTHFLRNSDLINNAVRLALCIEVKKIFIGSVIEDIEVSESFPDNHPDYLEIKNSEINKALEIMKEEKIEIRTPFTEIKWNKEDILDFLKTNFEKINLNLTRSCYTENEIPCGKCRACIKRKELEL